jgi:hypothetical protein
MSVIRFNGAALSTACTDLGQGAAPRFSCTATVDPSLPGSPLQAPGNIAVQVEKPGTQPAELSNQVSLVVVAEQSSEAVIALTAGSPIAVAQDIMVVEPTTAATNPGSQANMDSLGLVVGGNCQLRGSPVAIARPAAGTQDVPLCVAGPTALSAAFTFSISGPATPDVTIPSVQNFGAGIVQVTLRIPSTSQTGPRTLFVVNGQKEKSALTGAIEIR